MKNYSVTLWPFSIHFLTNPLDFFLLYMKTEQLHDCVSGFWGAGGVILPLKNVPL